MKTLFVVDLEAVEVAGLKMAINRESLTREDLLCHISRLSG